MPANKIQANYDELRRAVEALRQQADEVNDLERAVSQTVSVLERGDWIGIGAEKFYDEMRTLVFPGLRRLIGALQDGNQDVQRSSQILSEAELEAARLFMGGGAVDGSFGGSGFADGGYMDAGEAAFKETFTAADVVRVAQANVTNRIRAILPQAGALLQNTQTGQSLLADAVAANVRFDFSELGIPGLRTMGSTAANATVVKVKFDQGMDTAAGSFRASDNTIRISLTPYQYKTMLRPEELANTLAHEMQHGVDANTPGLLVNKFPSPMTIIAESPAVLQKQLGAWIEDQALTETRAHLRGYLLEAEANGGNMASFANDFLPPAFQRDPIDTLDETFPMTQNEINQLAGGIRNTTTFWQTAPNQRGYILDYRGYASNYKNTIQDIYDSISKEFPAFGKYRVAVAVGPNGNVGVGIAQVKYP